MGLIAGNKLETRNVPTRELRLIGENDGKIAKITGYASVFGKPSEDLGGFIETVRRGAFQESLKNNDIRALVDHESSKVLGRMSAGTLQIVEDDEGLRVEIDPPDTTYARDLQESLRRGDITGMSFGFVVEEDEWNTTETGKTRELVRVNLHEVSVVTFPAYPDTSAAIRSFDRWKKEHPNRAKWAELRIRVSGK